jgi:phosphoenolpyruvate carboxylase
MFFNLFITGQAPDINVEKRDKMLPLLCSLVSFSNAQIHKYNFQPINEICVPIVSKYTL